MLKPTVFIDDLEEVLYRENSCVAEDDVPQLMLIFSRIARTTSRDCQDWLLEYQSKLHEKINDARSDAIDWTDS